MNGKQQKELQPGWICQWNTPSGLKTVRIVETGFAHWGRQSLVVATTGDEKMGVATNDDLAVIEERDPPAAKKQVYEKTPARSLLETIERGSDEKITRYKHI